MPGGNASGGKRIPGRCDFSRGRPRDRLGGERPAREGAGSYQRRFRVGYLSHVPHRSFLDTPAQHPALGGVRIPLQQPEAAVLEALRSLDAFYCMASRDELPKPFHVRAELLRALPDLLMVGSTGAGYDTVDPEACTEAGVLLVNQAGGNAEGVAEHAVGM